MENKQPKMINQLHLIYPLIIAAISMVSLATYYYGGGSKAGEMVSFASTLSSIILSVIAIIMTIVDVAGQRNTILDLKETAEKLSETNEKSQELNINIMDKLDEIALLRDQLIEQINSNTEWKDDIKKLLQGSAKDISPDDYQKIVEEAKKIIENTSNNINKNNVLIPGFSDIAGSVSISTSKGNINKVKSYLKSEYKNGEAESMYILIEKIAIELGITKSLAKALLKTLEGQGYLDISHNLVKFISIN